jgi:hypothetical protein
MATLRKADERGLTQLDWLKSRHSFSFGDYIDPAHHHYRSLRVINEDWVAQGAGFGTHPHRDMEILTYMLKGELQHRDSMGNGSIITPGEWQYMSAGTGVLHSEFNPNNDQEAHLLQIWLMPDRKGYTPRYEQKRFTNVPGQWTNIVAPEGHGDGNVIQIRQNAYLKTAELAAGQTLTHEVKPNRGAWLQLVAGDAAVNGTPLHTGDALAIDTAGAVTISTATTASVLLFDLA